MLLKVIDINLDVLINDKNAEQDDYGVMHQSKTISEQSSEFLCNTDDYGVMYKSKAILEQSSKFLCITDVYGFCAPK